MPRPRRRVSEREPGAASGVSHGVPHNGHVRCHRTRPRVHAQRAMAREPERELLSVDGREVAISNPDKVLFPGPGSHQARSCALLPGGRRRRAARAGGRPNVLVRYPRRRRRRVLLPEARAGRAPAVGGGRLAALPVRAHGRRGRAARRRGARLDGEPGLPRTAPASGPRRRPRPSRRAARRSRSGPRRARGSSCARWRAWCAPPSTTSA